MVQFGQLVVGPPGAGKSTYCAGLQQFYRSQGRPVAIINLDPANTSPPYEAAVDVAELVRLEEVMAEFQLGPNGALIYYIDHLRENLDWLKEKLRPLEGHYLLFDLPGQVELFMMHDALKDVIATMVKQWELRLTAIHLVDSHLCCDPNKYLSALLLSLSTMLHLELPHINVLSKMDLLEQYGELAFNLDYYMDVQDLSYLVQHMERSNPRMSKRYSKLTAGLCELVEDFALVSFAGVSISDRESVATLVALIDKSNGYVFQGLRQRNQADGELAPPEMVYTATRTQTEDERVMSLQDRYVGAGSSGGGGGSGGEPSHHAASRQHAEHAGGASVEETAGGGANACAACGGDSSPGSALQRCSRCHSVRYCSVGCQRTHWPAHKASCAAAAAAGASGSGGVLAGR